MIRARCHPALEPILPRPRAARAVLPDWFRAMPAEVQAESLGGAEVRTFKHCPPLIDALSTGVMIPLAADLTVARGEISWDWDPPILTDARITRAPVGLHVPEQASGAPFRLDIGAVVKFMNFWTLEAEPGFSLLFVHPLNREDLPFRTLAGLVDCDRFRDGYVHFPAIWSDPGFSGRLAAGTPVAQAFPIRREALELACEPMGATELARHREVQQALQAEPGAYRKHFRVGLPKG